MIDIAEIAESFARRLEANAADAELRKLTVCNLSTLSNEEARMLAGFIRNALTMIEDAGLDPVPAYSVLKIKGLEGPVFVFGEVSSDTLPKFMMYGTTLLYERPIARKTTTDPVRPLDLAILLNHAFNCGKTGGAWSDYTPPEGRVLTRVTDALRSDTPFSGDEND